MGPETRPEPGPRGLQGSSALVPGLVVRSGVAQHHLPRHPTISTPNIPSYWLRACHRALRETYEVQHIGWAEAIRSFGLKLWTRTAAAVPSRAGRAAARLRPGPEGSPFPGWGALRVPTLGALPPPRPWRGSPGVFSAKDEGGSGRVNPLTGGFGGGRRHGTLRGHIPVERLDRGAVEAAALAVPGGHAGEHGDQRQGASLLSGTSNTPSACPRFRIASAGSRSRA